MDAFFRYKQIRMASKDEEKASFTTNQDLYYYKVIPFSLKDTRVPYQYLVNKIFKN